MGLCASGEPENYETINPYDGDTFLCFRHGEGTYRFSNGDTYTGQWKCNNLHGHGFYTHANGNLKREDYEDIVRYDGGTLLCFKHGEGTNFYENGDMYKGQWKWNQMHGHGVYTHANGEVRQGYFYHNEYIGKDAGNLFAATTCCIGSCFGGGGQAEPIPSDEEIRKQAISERAEQNAKEKEARQRQRDEMRKKYNIKKNPDLSNRPY